MSSLFAVALLSAGLLVSLFCGLLSLMVFLVFLCLLSVSLGVCLAHTPLKFNKHSIIVSLLHHCLLLSHKLLQTHKENLLGYQITDPLLLATSPVSCTTSIKVQRHAVWLDVMS